MNARLIALIRAGGPTGDFSSLGCGGKFHQLNAHFEELPISVQSLGLGEHARVLLQCRRQACPCGE